jgi:transcriptional regulator with XRE-family HTH domain
VRHTTRPAFGAVLQEIRIARRLSQWNLLRKLQDRLARDRARNPDCPGHGIQRATISFYETGRRVPGIFQMRALIDALSCSPREVRLLIDSAAVTDLRYTGFSLGHRDDDDVEFLLAWETLLATAESPRIPEIIPST